MVVHVLGDIIHGHVSFGCSLCVNFSATSRLLGENKSKCSVYFHFRWNDSGSNEGIDNDEINHFSTLWLVWTLQSLFDVEKHRLKLENKNID